MTFAPIKKQRIGEQVADALRESILRGEFLPGDPLPSERELATRFQVNRASIREALTRLETLGLLEIRHGGATTVRDFLTTAGLQLLPFLVAPGGVPNLALLADLLELRVALLKWTARQATRRKNAKALQKLRELISCMERNEATPRQLKVWDFDFFQTMVKMTENRVLILVVNAIRQVYLGQPELFDQLYATTVFDTAYHRTALAAMTAGDGDGAARAMEQYGTAALARCTPKHAQEKRGKDKQTQEKKRK
jgi:fatty acid metabolism transcriptional regulator FadR